MMENLRAIFVGEGSAAASERFYHECVFAAGPIDEEGLGLEEPAAPRGWERLERNATARHLRKGQVGIQQCSAEQIAEYFHEFYNETFNSAIDALDERFAVPEIVAHMEEYMAIVDFAEDIPECIMHIAEYYADDLSASRMWIELKQFRYYETSNGFKVALTADDLGKSLATNKTLQILLAHLCLVVQLVLLIPGTSCTAERSFSSLRRLKTHLRSSMKLKRLNHIAVLHLHKQYVDTIDIEAIVDTWRSVAQRMNAVCSTTELKSWKPEKQN